MFRQDNSTRANQASVDIADDTDSTVVWPDPSPLASWWAQVMQPGAGSRTAARGR
ncbi:hypothetical protein [Nocardia brasiliensis]|uniref:hypothetical protein n=1 Tax=Nocardia brasiliensis TaxID=37326 RepID=UPI0002FE0C7F|nr:hypothetical protein [Nocardia brasiliensis]